MTGITDAEDRIVLVVGDGCNNVDLGTPTITRASLELRVQGLGWPAEVAGVPIGDDTVDCPDDPGTGDPMEVSQYYEEQVVTLSQASSPLELLYHATAASDPLDPDHFEYRLRRILKELTCCMADFNGDGVHDIFTDQPAFYALFDPTAGDPHPAADLNYDGAWDSTDETLFFQLLSSDCPCGQ